MSWVRVRIKKSWLKRNLSVQGSFHVTLGDCGDPSPVDFSPCTSLVELIPLQIDVIGPLADELQLFGGELRSALAGDV